MRGCAGGTARFLEWNVREYSDDRAELQRDPPELSVSGVWTDMAWRQSLVFLTQLDREMSIFKIVQYHLAFL